MFQLSISCAFFGWKFNRIRKKNFFLLPLRSRILHSLPHRIYVTDR
jgi:hypothetical protein